MTTKQSATPLRPQQIAQYQKAGRGFLITRNSATLADTDYEHVAKEIVDALNKRHAYQQLVEAMRDIDRTSMGNAAIIKARALLAKLGEQ